MGFRDLGLDPILIHAAKRKSFLEPTEIQSVAIPEAFKGKDVVALSKTGTGKTVVFILPILNSWISKNISNVKPWTALILVPTKELILQVLSKRTVHKKLSFKVSEEFRSWIDLASMKIEVSSFGWSLFESSSQRLRSGHVVICTPKQIVQALKHDSTLLQNLEFLIVDEADLILSYGYEADMKTLSPKVLLSSVSGNNAF